MTETMHTPFALTFETFLLLPTPSSIHQRSYRDLFRKLHADPVFCDTAFGPSWPPKAWSDEHVKEVMQRDIDHRWNVKDMGDFALGIISPLILSETSVAEALCSSRPVVGSEREVRIVMDQSLEALARYFDQIRWIGYVCVRDATPACPVTEEPLPPWREMIEVRYGLDSSARGSGAATNAQAAVMQWAVGERGTRRFIAETRKENFRSAKVLERMGFTRSGTNYWQLEDTVEWVKNAGQ